jgi:hypothetical protein
MVLQVVLFWFFLSLFNVMAGLEITKVEILILDILTSDCRRVLNVVCFILGCCAACGV